MKSLVVFALKDEAAPFRRLLPDSPSLSTMVTGIGRHNTAKTFRAWLDGRAGDSAPFTVFTCGFAGALAPDLKIGDVIFTTASENLRLRLLAAGAKSASIHCADRIAVTLAEKQALRQKTAADAVEMESAVIQDLCREHALPCATVRVISDTAHEDLPLDFNALSGPDQNLDFTKLAFALVRSPGKIPSLMKLGRHTRLAAANLATVLQQVISPA